MRQSGKLTRPPRHSYLTVPWAFYPHRVSDFLTRFCDFICTEAEKSHQKLKKKVILLFDKILTLFYRFKYPHCLLCYNWDKWTKNYMHRVSQNSNPKTMWITVNFENIDFIKITLILGHPVHGILNLISKSDSATSNYYMQQFSTIYLNSITKNYVRILSNSKITFSSFLMLFLSDCAY